MNKLTGLMLALVILTIGRGMPAAAGSVGARCGFSGSPGDIPAKTIPCTFAQRQGYVDIYLDGVATISLAPVGDEPGNYADQQGRPAYRRSGLDSKGTIFQLEDRTVFVYWQHRELSCDRAQLSAAQGCTLSSQTLTFRLSTTDSGSLNQLHIVPSGLSRDSSPIQVEIDGSAYRAEIADLDTNGWPEIYVYVSSAGSGSYGSLYAYAVNRGKSLSAIYLPPMDADASAAEGYRGHDAFAVVGNRLVRRFPVYRPADINAEPGGGSRQLHYRLQAGEAGWLLVLDQVVD